MPTTARSRFACLAARLHRAAALGFLALGVTFGAASPTLAQSADEAEKSSFVRFVEEQISTPDQKISLGRIDGALSSDVRIGSITIADRQGVWLEVTGVHLVWSRLALLQKRLEIDSLEAQAIRVLRRPAATGPEVAATPTFALPDLPVAVRIGKLAVPSVDLGEGIAGIPARFSVDGRASLAKDVLDAQLAIQRLDGSGRLAFKLGYADQTRKLDLDLTLSEGAGGFLGTLLDIRGRPALDLAVRGSAPIDSFTADIALEADKARLVSGRAAIGRNAFGYRFALEANGSLERLVSERWGAYFAGSSSIALVAEAAESGWKISRASIASGAATFEGNGALATDGFPTALTVDARLGGRGTRVPLPFTDGTVAGARLAIDYGEAATWKASIRADGFESADAKLGSAALEASGVARNLADPAARSLSFTLSGGIAGLQAGDAAKAFRDPIRIAGRGNWRAGAATLVEGFSVSDGNASVNFDGSLGLSAVTGAARIGVKDLAPFSALADRPLHGSTALTATGRYEPIGGAFDLTLDGATTDLSAGLGRADALLGGRLALKGRVARATDGLHFEGLQLGNGRIEASVSGLLGRWTSDLAIKAAIADVGIATDRAKGRVALDARVTGASEKPTVAARIAGSNLVLQGRPFRDAALRFDGTVAPGEIDGIVALGGDLGGRSVSGQARLTSLANGGQAIEALIFRVGRSTINGDVTLDEAGLAEGALAIASPDLGEVAPLVLMTAGGSVDAKIGLSRANGRQDVKAKGAAKGVKIEAISIAGADFDLSAQDLRGRPAITGTATARIIATPAATVAKIDARATPGPDGATRFDVTADGIAPTALRNAGIGALTARARGTLAERLVRFDAEASAGGGIRLTAGGSAAIDGASLDVAVKGSLPLAAANGFLRDRATRLAGTATLDLRVTGSAAEPRPAGTVTIGGFTLADPETGFRLANGQGRIWLGDGRATVESFSATTGSAGTIAVSGTIGLPPADGLPADLTIRLARAHVTNGDLLTADVSGAVTVRGPLAGAPTIGGSITVDRAEITIPERFSGRVTMLDVRQIAPPPKVARTLAKARTAIAPRSSAKSATGMVLALTIDAPARVFVRGRGLDTELGGRITLAGPIEAVRPVGAFQMIRGRLDVIGQRIDFTRGVVTLTGSLDPDIDFAAEAVRGSITITARVTGKASDPQIALTSSEDLPQDEILARFLFGQSITQLSPFQVVRLTVAVAQLAGGGQSADLVGKIRKSTGLDDLDIVTDSSGGTAVKVGRYLSDNIYFGVTTGGAGQTNATINLDITKNLKARGEAGTEGSSLGVFFEKEY